MARHAASQNIESDFGGPSGAMNDFGFHGSVGKAAPKHRPHKDRSGPATPMPGGDDGGGMSPVTQMAGGGHVHPHGHGVHRVEQKTDGSVVHHHAHGGYTTHHPDGQISHHSADGGVAANGFEGHEYAKGGHVMTHPHGHRVTHTESMNDREIHRHAHGGFTVHYHDGRPPTHHGNDGTPAYHAGGDVEQDKAMVTKGIRQHENHEHGGEHTDLKLARGGHVSGMPSMKPKARKPHKAKAMAEPMGAAMPVNRPPRRPEASPSPRNQFPGGAMSYGVQPSAEPDDSNGSAPVGSPGVGASPSGGAMGAPGGMRKGGSVKSRA